MRQFCAGPQVKAQPVEPFAGRFHQTFPDGIFADVIPRFRKLLVVADSMFEAIGLEADIRRSPQEAFPNSAGCLDGGREGKDREQVHVVGHDQKQAEKPTPAEVVEAGGIENGGGIGKKGLFPTSDRIHGHELNGFA